jgi:hypothetical protein
MIKFFVNGMFSHTNNGNGTVMRFLTEVDEGGYFLIKVYNETYNKTYKIKVKNNIAFVIKLLINDDKYDDTKLIHYKYKVKYNDEIVTGSFKIIGKKYKNDLNFGFVSCNDNCGNIEWNKYHDTNGSMWDKISKEKFDIIVHYGDQIYPDSVLQLYRDKKITITEIYEYIAQLYHATYNEKYQRQSMRNCLNLMIMDDHDAADNYATPYWENTNKDEIWNKYLSCALRAYRDYQCNLHYNKFNKFTKNYSYSMNIGKYKLVLMDQRNTLRYNNTSIDKYTIHFVKKEIYNSIGKDILLISPRPFGHLDKFHAWLQGKVSGDGVDELLHPISFDNTMTLRDILFAYKKMNKDNILYIISGDVHQTFIQTHVKQNIKIKELVSSAVSRSSRIDDGLLYNIYFWIQRNFNLLWFYGIRNRQNLSLKNNYGYMRNNILGNVSSK